MTPPLSDLTVVVPVRNGEAFIDECLRSIARSHPAAIIVVDGESTDRTLEIASTYPVDIVSDHGRGVAVARSIGAHRARTAWVAFVDVDVVLPARALERLLDEAAAHDYVALQAGLESVSGPGYWGRALVDHHRSGVSRYWFGLVATVFRREAFLRYGLDARFSTGEDIELRHRLERAGERIGVSKRTVVTHRFGDTFEFASGQFLADGAGLARTVLKHGWGAAPLLALPVVAAIRGVLLALARGRPQWIPYFAAFLALNWYAMGRHFVRRLSGHR